MGVYHYLCGALLRYPAAQCCTLYRPCTLYPLLCNVQLTTQDIHGGYHVLVAAGMSCLLKARIPIVIAININMVVIGNDIISITEKYT